jgi:hypothetical protein
MALSNINSFDIPSWEYVIDVDVTAINTRIENLTPVHVGVVYLLALKINCVCAP